MTYQIPCVHLQNRRDEFANPKETLELSFSICFGPLLLVSAPYSWKSRSDVWIPISFIFCLRISSKVRVHEGGQMRSLVPNIHIFRS